MLAVRYVVLNDSTVQEGICLRITKLVAGKHHACQGCQTRPADSLDDPQRSSRGPP